MGDFDKYLNPGFQVPGDGSVTYETIGYTNDVVELPAGQILSPKGRPTQKRFTTSSFSPWRAQAAAMSSREK